MVIQNASVLGHTFRFQKADVKIDNGIISEIGQGLSALEIFDGSGLLLLPGLIDIHTHGCVNYDTCDADPGGYRKMARFYASRGVTSFLFTTMTLHEDRLREILACVSGYMEEQAEGAYAHGIYLEGPFFSSERKGAQDATYLLEPDADTFRRFQRAAGGNIKIAAVAPELPGSTAFIEELHKECAITLAHTAADYNTAKLALEQGARSVTHLFNGMNVFHHREPGVVGAALDKAEFVELICDGIHSHPSAARMVFRALGEDRLILISDSMRAAGMPDGDYTLGGQPVTVKGNRALLQGTDTIAGSATNLLDCVKCADSFGVPLETAVRAATINPARLIGVDRQTGSIAVGKSADLLAVDRNLNVKGVWIKGKRWNI